MVSTHSIFVYLFFLERGRGETVPFGVTLLFADPLVDLVLSASGLPSLDEALAGRPSFFLEPNNPPRPPAASDSELLGTTPDDREQLVRWSNAIITNDDPDYSPSEEYRTQAGEEMMQYALDMLAERRDSPKDDLASVLAEKLALGELSIEEYSGYVTLLFVAGNETTRNNISHGLLQLAQNPDQYELLKTGEHWDTAVEEMIRWSSPVIYMSRTVVEDVEYKGHHFAKGDKVVLHYASANRDEDVFENPMTFDVTRDPNPHIAFGFGAHFCLGAHLARLETRCVLEQLVKRVDRLELVGQEAYVWSSFIAGIKKLDVKLALN